MNLSTSRPVRFAAMVLAAAMAIVVASPLGAHAVTSPSLATNDVSQPGPAFAAPGASNVLLFSFTLTGGSSQDHMKFFRARWSGSANVPTPDVVRFRVYREKGSIAGSSFSAASDTHVRAFTPGAASEIKFDVPDYRFAQTKLYITADLRTNATPGRILDMRIESDKIELKSGTWPPVAEATIGALWNPNGNVTINSSPTAAARSLATPEDSILPVTLTGSDEDQGHQTTMSISSPPSHGTLGAIGVPTCDGGSPKICSSSVNYTPDANFVGHDSFSYRATDQLGAVSEPAVVAIAVGPVDDWPLAFADAASTPEETPVIVTPLTNDTDAENDPISISAFQTLTGNNATVSCSSTQCTYTPFANFYGIDTFWYTISDGVGTSTATVTVTVEGVNDAPVAAADNYDTDENTTLSITESSDQSGVLDNDTDIDGPDLTAVLVTDVSNGTLTLASDGTFVYSPSPSFFGVDTFTYRAGDGSLNSNVATASIYVGDVNHPPLAQDDAVVVAYGVASGIDVLVNDTSLPDTGETLTVSAITQGTSGAVAITGGGTGLVYTPSNGFTGEDSFTYTVSDGLGGTDEGSVTISVAPKATVTSATTLTGWTTATFTEPVRQVSPSNFRMTLTGSTTTVATTMRCLNASSVVDCAAGPVTTAQLRRTLVPGQKYTVRFGNGSSIEDVLGNAMPAQTDAFRASLIEQERSVGSRHTWGAVRNRTAYGGSFRAERMSTASSSFTFTGRGVSWYTIKGPSQGIAAVYIDGVLKKRVNNYSATTQYRVRRYFGSLSNRTHVMKIIVTGKRGSLAGKGTTVVVDAFKVGTKLYGTPSMTYTWAIRASSLASGRRFARTDRTGAQMTFAFRGTAVKWCSMRGPSEGKARVLIDGKSRGVFDNYRAATLYNTCRTFGSLSDSVHRITVVVLGQKRAGARGRYVAVDRWLVV